MPGPVLLSARLARGGAILGLALPLFVLATAYAAICARWGAPWPWDLPVHEDGRRSLLNTVFYFEHAARELPLDLLLGAAAGAGVHLAFPLPASPRGPMDRRDLAILAAAIAGPALILACAAWQVGPAGLGDNLLQRHTRPGAPLVWGSHWRYHLLERGPMILTAVGLGALLRAAAGRSGAAEGRAGAWAGAAAIGLYVALTAVFTPSLAALALPFQHPRYLGHEAREIMTHALVTLPLAFAGCMLLQAATAIPAQARPPGRAELAAGIGLGLAAAGLAAYSLAAAVAAGAGEHGQSAELAVLIFPHFFEHSLGYVVAPLTAAATYALCRAADQRER